LDSPPQNLTRRQNEIIALLREIGRVGVDDLRPSAAISTT
jgi:hypothetical protein